MSKKTKDTVLTEAIEVLVEKFLRDFKRITRYFALFHLAFLSLGILEIFAFILFFSFFIHSSWFALSLAALVLTGFSYFVLRFYFQLKKPEEVKQLCIQYFSAAADLLPSMHSQEEKRLFLADAATYLARKLHRLELTYYAIPVSFEGLRALFEKFSIWCHWKDVLFCEEMLLCRAIAEQISVLKGAPTNLQLHAELAKGYFSLVKLFLQPAESSRIPRSSDQEKIHMYARRAIEEYHILIHYAPQDPSAFRELAQLHQLLKQSTQEMEMYTKILELLPSDPEALLGLGLICFEQGMHAKGLQIYEKLQKMQDARAEMLMQKYDAYTGAQQWEKAYIAD